MSFSTETKANAAFIFALVLLAVVGIFRFVVVSGLIDKGRWVSHTHEVIAELEHVRYLAKSAESSERGYKLSYDKKIGDEIEKVHGTIEASIEKLRVLTADNVHQQANLGVLEKHLGRFFDAARSTLAGTVNAPTSQLLDSVLDQVQAAEQEEQELLAARSESVEKTGEFAGVTITAATVVSMIVLIGAMVLLNRDSRARRKAEADYRHSEERLGLLLNSVSEGIYGVGMDGKCTFANTACARTLGYASVDQLLGQDMHELIHHQFEDGRPYPMEQCRIYQAFHRGEEVLVSDEVFWRADKTCFPVEYRSCPVRRDGQILGAVVAFADITDRKRAERALSSARDLAMESARLKSEFLANMSHEIRTPLNGVIGMSELLISTKLAGREREYAITIRNSAESLLTILNDILDLSKIDAGKLTLESIHFNLQTIVEESGMLIAARASEKKLELIVRYAPSAPKTFIGDPVRVRQILSNLASNAVKFTQEGHVLISVACLAREDGRARMQMTVEDTGIGISDEYRTRLFQKFSQADASTTRQFGGTGLGLAISKNLVEMMGGTLGVRSIVGKGTVFTMEVPLPESDKKEDLSDTTLSKYALRARCLVVDDNAVNRMVVQEQLSVWQVPVKAVDDGEAALTELRRAVEAGEEYAVALLDYQMPRMNGETLAQRIKADPKIAKTVLVMLSSIGETFTRQQLHANGIVEMLHKPVRQSELFDALQSAWRIAFEGDAGMSSGEKQAVTDAAEVPTLNLRVLLVEDNDVNRTVAVGMLKRIGCACAIAVDGSEALTAVRANTFDVVLMDCQMPVMDGYTATQEIRRLEKAAGRERLPIVAMTANAMKGDRERCLEAGMDEYLAKPVRLQQLADVLARVSGRSALPRRHSKSAAPTQPATEEAAPPPPIFDENAAMRIVGGDAELLGEVIRVFLEDVPKRIAAIKIALLAGDKAIAERGAHSIKGASGNVGGERLRQAAFNLETVCRDNDLAQATMLIPGLELELATLRAELLKKAPNAGDSKAGPTA